MMAMLIHIRHSEHFRFEDNVHLTTIGFGPGEMAEEILRAGTGIWELSDYQR